MKYSSSELRAVLFFQRVYFLGSLSPSLTLCFPDVDLGAGRVPGNQKEREHGRVLGAGRLTDGSRAFPKLGALGTAER